MLKPILSHQFPPSFDFLACLRPWIEIASKVKPISGLAIFDGFERYPCAIGPPLYYTNGKEKEEGKRKISLMKSIYGRSGKEKKNLFDILHGIRTED